MVSYVSGVGVSTRGKHPRTVNRKMTHEYGIWRDMLRRCYCEERQRIQPTYRDCTVSENFKNFQYFAEWGNAQVGFGLDGYQLDKDILIKGNKIYSEDVCVFVPREINSLLIKCDNSRGELPVGVSYHKKTKKYVAQLSIEMKPHHLGLFDCPIKAFEKYKAEKESHIKQKTEEFKDLIDVRVYDALINYKVEVWD